MRVREILNLHSTTLCIVPEQCDIDHANQGPPVHIHTSATQDNSRQCWVLESGLNEYARGNTHRQDRKTRCCPWLADAAAMITQEFTQGEAPRSVCDTGSHTFLLRTVIMGECWVCQ